MSGYHVDMSTISTETNTGTYSIDPAHSRVGFVARHAMITKVRGAFNDLAGSGFFDADQPSESNLNVTIQPARARAASRMSRSAAK